MNLKKSFFLSQCLESGSDPLEKMDLAQKYLDPTYAGFKTDSGSNPLGKTDPDQKNLDPTVAGSAIFKKNITSAQIILPIKIPAKSSYITKEVYRGSFVKGS